MNSLKHKQVLFRPMKSESTYRGFEYKDVAEAVNNLIEIVIKDKTIRRVDKVHFIQLINNEFGRFD